MCCNKNDYRRRQINNFLITFITQTFAYFPEREYKKKSVNCFYRILIHKFCSSEAANRGVLQIICSAAIILQNRQNFASKLYEEERGQCF